jgi:invasion protein IalB
MMPSTSRLAARAAAALLLAVVLAPVAPAPADAQTPTEVGVFRDWAVFRHEAGGQRVCFMVSRPTRSQPENVRRGDIYITITNRPGDRIQDEVSFVSGYPFREGSEVSVEIGNDRFAMFTEGDTAWARDAETDRRLTDAIRRGSSMVVRGTSSRGTNTTDTFSLAGTGDAHRAAARACGLPERRD